MEHVIEKITHWLQEQVREAHANGLVVGVSGGLDSAVVAYLIKRAFPNDSLGVIMPIKSNVRDIEHAQLVLDQSSINGMTIDLTHTHQVMYDQIKQQIIEKNEWNEDKDQIANANLRARLRMSTLYTVATNYNYLVVGTDNASEWFTGYFTKYGDGGVDLLPIVDLTKHEVAELGKVLGIPNAIINKTPSADLWEGQTDEEEMGTTYQIIDAYLKGQPIPEKDRQLIEQMNRKTEHKRNIAKQLKLSRD